MKAAVFYDVEDIRLEDVPEPTIGDEDVLVEVTACGICGSDLEYYMGRSPVGTADGKGPLILGHEFAGARRRARQGRRGPAGGRPRRGQPRSSRAPSGDFSRSGNPHFDLSVVLGVTTNGAFAKYVRTKAEHAYKLPDSMSDEQGAFVEMLAASLNAVEKAQIRLGDLVRHLRPRARRALDGAARQGERRARRDRRHARLPARAGAGHGRRARVQHRRHLLAVLHRRPGRLDPARSNAGELADGRSSRRPPRAPRQARSTSPATARRSSTWASPARTTSSSCRCSRASRWTRRSASRGSIRTSGRTRSGCCARASSTPPRSSPTRSRSTSIDEGIRQVVARDDGVIKIIVKP